MKILTKKQKQKLIIQLLEKIIEIVPSLVVFYLVSKIGTYLGWNPRLIVKVIAAITVNNIITININDSKKTN